jgi:MerR family redox-sensitive transcriptional activator SoxR
MDMTSLSIGEVAARAGIRPSAIRYYESIGLLPEPQRVNQQRRYEPEVLTQLAVVRMAQEAGFTVAEIVTLFHGFEPGIAASERWRALAERKIAEIEALIARAETMRRVLGESLRCNCLTLDECGVTGWDTTATDN